MIETNDHCWPRLEVGQADQKTRRYQMLAFKKGIGIHLSKSLEMRKRRFGMDTTTTTTYHSSSYFFSHCDSPKVYNKKTEWTQNNAFIKCKMKACLNIFEIALK